MEEKKVKRMRELEEREGNDLQTQHKTRTYSYDSLDARIEIILDLIWLREKTKTKRNSNAVKGFDYQMRKYRNAVQLVDKRFESK